METEKKGYYQIYELTPAPWGSDYRYIESFERKEDAEYVLAALEKVNVLFNCYQIVFREDEQETYTTDGNYHFSITGQ